MKKCHKCFCIYTQDTKENYCGSCGIKLEPADKCVCGEVIRLYLSGERYCRNCGKPLPQEIVDRYFKGR